jgi:hypothetical protein
MRMIFVFCIAAIIGCSSSTNYTATSQDSIMYSDTTLSLQNTSDVPDSIARQQEKIAFGDIQFGMTKKQVEKLIRSSYQEKIGEYEYWFTPMYDHNGKLYKIEFKSSDRDANYIDTYVKSSLDNLYETIKSKYGDGTYVQSFPNVLEFQSGYVRYTNRWNIGDKEIVVGAGEVSSGSEFYSFCWIFSKSMNEAQENYQKTSADSVKSKDATKF